MGCLCLGSVQKAPFDLRRQQKSLFVYSLVSSAELTRAFPPLCRCRIPVLQHHTIYTTDGKSSSIQILIDSKSHRSWPVAIVVGDDGTRSWSPALSGRS